ncbi:hypothetical protein C1646_775700, partial [Rhizophagus diaphanus]
MVTDQNHSSDSTSTEQKVIRYTKILAQAFGLDKQNAEVYSALSSENRALKKQLENYHSQQNTLEKKVKRLERNVKSLETELKDLNELTETYEERYIRPLPNEGDIYVGLPWKMGKTYILENLTIPNDSYCDIDGNINLPNHKRIVCQIESLHRITNNCKCNKKCKCLPFQFDLWLDEIVSIIAQAQSRLTGQLIEKPYKLIQEARRIIKGKTFRLAPNKETVLTELWDWAKQTFLLPFEKHKSASLICHLRKDVQGIVRALKTDFPELRIKEYHSKSDLMEKAQDFSNVEESWSDVDLVAYTSTLKIGLLNAKRECLPRELQNRGVFPDIDSIIQNKDRIVDFLREASMIISIIEPISKSEENVVSLSQVVKANSSIVKAEEISDIFNVTIVDHETAEFLENKSRKTLKEMRSLDRHHIVECYEILPESLTKNFISKYGNYNHMKWFRAYKQLRDASTNNETAVEAISHKDYREDRLTTATWAEKHQICLELLRNCTPVKDIDDRTRYKANDVKTRMESPESISYLQDLVPKMAR